MDNTVFLLGRISKITKEENNVVIDMLVSDKKVNGENEEDKINVTINLLSKTMSDAVVKHCKDGDIIGCRGHISYIDTTMAVIADKISFLASAKEEE